jgi:hypothetical protein
MYTELGDAMEFAVQSFAVARPNGIYKDDYLKDLGVMFSTDEELVCPGRPEWEDDLNPPYNFSAWKSNGTEQNGHSVLVEQPSTSTSEAVSHMGNIYLFTYNFKLKCS